jgi:hypothetical protein
VANCAGQQLRENLLLREAGKELEAAAKAVTCLKACLHFTEHFGIVFSSRTMPKIINIASL